VRALHHEPANDPMRPLWWRAAGSVGAAMAALDGPAMRVLQSDVMRGGTSVADRQRAAAA
jgi:hypothetical protein